MNQGAGGPANGPTPGDPDRPAPRHGRAALLRLAAWFESADADTAAEIFTAAFATHAATHLGSTGVEGSATTASWWSAPRAQTATPPFAGTPPAAPVDDHTDQRARLRDAAESSAHWRRSAAQEVRRALAQPTEGDCHLHLSSVGLRVLMELLAAALGSGGEATRGPVEASDLELDIRLHVQRVPSASITLRGADGDLTLEALRLQATSYATPTPVPDANANPADPGDPRASISTVRLARQA